MENSKIEWCEHTFNPWIGCTKISPACDHCYAADRSARSDKVKWGAGEARKRTSEVNWKQPLKWDAEAAKAGIRPRVFCASLADVFDNEIDPQWRADLFQLVKDTPNLDWMILTKRIGNAEKMMQEACDLMDSGRGVFAPSIYPNVHLGITICNQAEADRDIQKLLATPAAKRFLSIEPMLGPIDLDHARGGIGGASITRRPARLIDLVIFGGESGPHARPSHPDWFRSLREQCAEAGLAFMFKQWGEFSDKINTGNYDRKYKVKSVVFVEPDGRHGPIMLEADGHGYPSPENHAWNWETAFGETLNPAAVFLQRVGKKAAGRLLDGVEHNGRIL